MQKDFCNCALSCECECPKDLFPCPLDNISNLEKDRSISRRRHHSSVKAKDKALRTATFLASKITRIPEKSRCRESRSAMSKRAWNATKKSQKFKKQMGKFKDKKQFLVRK